MSEVPVEDFFEICFAQRHTCTSQFVGKVIVQMCSHSNQCVLIKCESQELHNVSEQHSKDLRARKIVKRAQSLFRKC